MNILDFSVRSVREQWNGFVSTHNDVAEAIHVGGGGFLWEGRYRKKKKEWEEELGSGKSRRDLS